MNASLKMCLAFMVFHMTCQSQTVLTTSISSSGSATVCAPATVSLSVSTPGNGWLGKSTYAGVNYNAFTGFSINDKGYVGGGTGPVVLGTDFWEYDPVSDTWTQKANMPARSAGLGFSIGSKGYLCFGIANTLGSLISNQLFEYDPVGNTWIQKANFPGNPRNAAIGFSINNKGYVGTGGDNQGVYYDDFWEYDPVTDVWTPKANLPGGLREGAFGFAIGSKGYAGAGWNFTQWGLTRDFWEYDPITDAWTQRANFGGNARTGAQCFNIGCKGYVGNGGAQTNYNDFWQYDPVTNAWTQKQNFPIVPTATGPSFGILDKGYAMAYNGVPMKMFEYTPAFSTAWSTGAVTPSIIATVSNTYSVSVNSETCFTSTASIDVVVNQPVAPVTGFTYPSPVCLAGSDPLPIPDPGFSSGGVFSGAGMSLDGSTGKIHLQNTGPGTYTVIYTVNASNCTLAGTNSVSVNIYQNPSLSVNSNTILVLGESVGLSATSSANTYTWFPGSGLSCTDCANPVATPVETSLYCVRTTDGVCTNTACVLVSLQEPCLENSVFSVPNAFSPNGDGQNDVFCVQGSNRYITSFSLSIYDRWGEKVYETSDFDSCWDGTYKGRRLNPDVFVYYIKALCGEKKQVVKKGNVTLIQ